MRFLLPLTLGLFACQTTPSAPTPEDLQAALELRSVEAATAIAAADLDAGMAMASAAARPFFDAQRRLFELIGEDELEMERVGDPEVEFISANHDGASGTGVLTLTESGESTDMILHFVLEDGEWRIDGFSEALGDEPTRLADMVEMVEQQLAMFEEELEPHPEMVPLIEAYLQAIPTKDAAAMKACMTDECWQSQQRGTSWTQSYLRGEITLVEWDYSYKDDEDGNVLQAVDVLVESASGERDGDSMRFQGAAFDGLWKITELN